MQTTLEEMFRAVGVVGYVHAREVAAAPDAPEVDLRGDHRVVLASVFKIAVSVALARAVAEGRVDPSATATVSAQYRRGGTGLAGCRHDVRASLADLGELMMTLSDNAATDVVMDAVGMSAIRTVLDDLDLRRTAIHGRTIDDLALELAELEAMGVHLSTDPQDPWAGVPGDLLMQLSTVDPARTGTYSTPRDVTRLLEAVWTDDAAAPQACAAVRATMGRQVWRHRLAAGFDSRYRVAGKTGTLEGIRNEAGVISDPEGRSFAVAVFTRSDNPAAHNPAHDAVIGRAARWCVDQLTSTPQTDRR